MPASDDAQVVFVHASLDPELGEARKSSTGMRAVDAMQLAIVYLSGLASLFVDIAIVANFIAVGTRDCLPF